MQQLAQPDAIQCIGTDLGIDPEIAFTALIQHCQPGARRYWIGPNGVRFWPFVWRLNCRIDGMGNLKYPTHTLFRLSAVRLTGTLIRIIKPRVTYQSSSATARAVNSITGRVRPLVE